MKATAPREDSTTSDSRSEYSRTESVRCVSTCLPHTEDAYIHTLKTLALFKSGGLSAFKKGNITHMNLSLTNKGLNLTTVTLNDSYTRGTNLGCICTEWDNAEL